AWHGLREQTKNSRRCGERKPSVLRIGLPLPLHSQARSVELVARVRCRARAGAAINGQSIRVNRLAHAVAVRIDADDGPVITPTHRLQMDDAPVGAAVLKVYEPRIARRGLDPAALVRSVDRRAAASEDDAVFV